MSYKKIVILAGSGKSTNIVYNALSKDFDIEKVIIEEPIPRIEFIKRRIKRLGLIRVFGQILFELMVVPYLNVISYKRMQEIKKQYGLCDKPVDESKTIRVKSVNADETIVLLKNINPDIVVINGTRIISDKVLDSIKASFINMHAGITPMYRGVHGAYWALVENNMQACGVTIHFVDKGIDTGKILEQGVITTTLKDTFVTYPLLQLAIGIPLLKKAINNVLENHIEIKPYPEGKSTLRSHPTLWEYLFYRIKYRVK
jgi:folate-dependent phosphoribosylglycinamide formyltransferase PurN